MKLRKILLIAFVIMSAQNAIAEVSGEDILIYSPDGRRLSIEVVQPFRMKNRMQRCLLTRAGMIRRGAGLVRRASQQAVIAPKQTLLPFRCHLLPNS